MTDPKPASLLKYWLFIFILSLVEGVISFISLVLIPREVENGILFGFSATRLLSMTAILVMICLLAFFSWFTWRRPEFRATWLDPDQKPRLHAWLHAVLVLGMFASGLALFWLRYWDEDQLMSLFTRAMPSLMFLFLLCGQMALWLLVLRNEVSFNKLLLRRNAYSAGLIIFAIFMAVAIFIAATGIGVTPDSAYWSEPGVPLLAWQTVLAILGGWLILMLGLNNWIAKNGRLFDLALGITIWGLAIAIWMQVPLNVLAHSFYAPIWPPSTEPLPYSDAGMYDFMARSLLLGHGFGNVIPPRPMYIVFLAGIHALFGDSYSQTVLGQTLVLALFPVVLFFLGRKLHSRAAGITIGLLAIFRELTALWVSSGTRVANSKLLLSDLPTALAVAAFVLLAVHWLTKKERRSFDAFLVGGMFGLLLFLRAQVVFTLAGLVLAAIFGRRTTWKRTLVNASVFLVGIILAITPWMVRNWIVTGSPVMDDPAQMHMITSMYVDGTPNANPTIASMTSSEAAITVIQVIFHQPGHVLRFVTAHFLANEIDTLLVLPLAGISEGFNTPVPLYWLNLAEYLNWQHICLLVLYLSLIAIGAGACWKHMGWAGLLPLLFNVFYSLSNGVARISGWRYALPTDWTGYFYFGIGVVELLAGVVLIFGGQPSRLFHIPDLKPFPASEKPARIPGWKTAAVAIMIVLIGGLPVILENVIPAHFDETTTEELALQLASSPAARSIDIKNDQLQDFITQPGAVLVTGRLIYPRFFMPDQGIRSATPWAAFLNRDYTRMGFILLTRQGVFQAVLPLMDLPDHFPENQDVLLLGCSDQGYIDVRVLIFPSDNIIFSGDPLTQSCESR